MKTMLCITFFMAFNLVQNPVSIKNTGEMKLQLSNVNVNNKGVIYIAIYNKKQDFMTRNFFKSTKVEVGEDSSIDVVFDAIPYGFYAVSAYHDINANQQMDFNENGMPIEDYAMSGTPNQMGPPNWEQVKFEFKDETQVINLNF